MSEDLQSLLERINRDGVEKAEGEAKKIVEAAKAQAAEIVAAARAEAEKARAAAEKDAAAYAARAAETVREGARDTLAQIEQAVTALLERLLKRDVDAALATPAAVEMAVAQAFAELVGPGEVASSPALAKTLAAQLAAQGSFTVTTDETLASGFTVRVEGGRVEHSFTGAAVAEALARRLRPDLAKLLK